MNKEDATKRISDFFQELSKEGVIVHSFHGDWIAASTREGRKFRLANVRVDVGIHRGWADEDD